MTILPNIGKPATAALKSIGITTLEQVKHLDQQTLLKIHGVGPKAVSILENALYEKNWSFKAPTTNPILNRMTFAVICPIDCKNAPKKQMIYDYLIASTAGDKLWLNNLLTDSMTWIVPNELQLTGKTAFIQELLKHKRDISSLEIQSILSHGKEGSAHGVLTDKKGNKIYFSDIFYFSSHKKDAPISQITSFVVM